MTLSITHPFVSAVSDGGNTALVQPSNWNAAHTITMATAKMLGRATAGSGTVEEIATTGTGSAVLATSPTLVTPVLGTPSSGTLTNCTGLPIAGGGTGQTTATAAFDALGPTTTRGDIIFRGASNNVRLAAGTAGYRLQTNGASADPTWVAARELLMASRTYYVRTDGSDSNTGLVNSAGGAFLTISKAISVIRDTLDLGGNIVTISVGAGTYTGQVSIVGPFTGQATRGGVKISGDTTTPANVVISTAGSAFTIDGGVRIAIEGVKVTTSAGYGFYITGASQLDISGKIDLGSVTNSHFIVFNNSYLVISAAYNITGGCQAHLNLGNGGMAECYSLTATITGTPAWSVAFLYMDTGSKINTSGMTYSGASTGSRYSVSGVSIGNTNGGGASYFPGNAAGSTATGGQYV